LFYQKNKIEKIFKSLFIVSTLVGIYTLIQVFTGIDIFRPGPYMEIIPGEIVFWRAKGFFRNTMTYSYSIGMLFCFLVPFYFWVIRKTTSGWKLHLWNLTIIIIGSSLLFTFTRGLWISLSLALTVMALRVDKKLCAKFIFGLALFFTSAYILSNQVRDKVNSIVSTKNASNFQRLDVWAANWEMFKDNPVLGVGFSRNDDELPKYYEKVKPRKKFIGHAHNNYLQVLAGNGALGFLFYVLMMWGFARIFLVKIGDLDPLKKSLVVGAIGAQLVFHIGGLTESTFIDNETWHMFMFLYMSARVGIANVDS
jgi:O-antigen ligase